MLFEDIIICKYLRFVIILASMVLNDCTLLSWNENHFLSDTFSDYNRTILHTKIKLDNLKTHSMKRANDYPK